MKLFFLVAVLAFGQEFSHVGRTFSDGQSQVMLYIDEWGVIMPVLVTKHEGDEAQLTVFYRQSIAFGGKATELTRAKHVICPVVVPDGGGMCDAIEGVPLSDVMWVRVKFFKTLAETEIGRPAK